MANARPEIFRPSWYLILGLRLEEFDDTGALVSRLAPLAPGASPVSQPMAPDVAAAPSQVTTLQVSMQLAQLDATIAGTQALVDEGFAPQTLIDDLNTQRQALTDQLGQLPASTADAPEYVSGPSPDDRRITIQVVPTSFKIDRNDLRTADELDVTLDYRDFPFDTRLLRGAHCTLVLGLVDPRDYERGMRGERRPATGGQSQGALWSYPQLGDRNTTRFDGVVDDGEVTWSGSGDEFTFHCRDFTALCLDTPVATGTAIDLSLPIDQGIQAFLRMYPTLAGVVVTYGREGETGTPPVPGTAAPQATAPRQRRAASGARRGQTQHRSTDQNQNLWDSVTDVCARCGLVATFDGFQIRIIDPRTYYTDRNNPVRVVYGQYLTEFAIKRRLGAIRVPTYEVRSYDPDIGRVRWARYPVPAGATASASAGILGVTNPPTRPQRANDPSVSGWNPTERIRTISVRGVNDPDVLRRIARAAFEQVGRQELEGHVTTDSPTSSTEIGALDQADLINLKNGDAIEILISGSRGAPAAQVQAMSLAELTAMEVSRRTDYLRSLGWSENVANVFARAAQALAGQTIFYVKGVQISGDSTEGLQIQIDFINYIQIRESAQSVQDNGVPAVTPTDETISVTAPLVQAQAENDALTRQLADGVVTQAEYNERAAAISDRMTAIYQGNA